MATTGAQLRKFRRLSEVTVTALAARLGCSRQTIHNLENATLVSADRATRYRQAVRDVIRASGDEAK